MFPNINSTLIKAHKIYKQQYFTHENRIVILLMLPSIPTALKRISSVCNWITDNIDKNEIKIRKLQQSKHVVE